MVSIEISYRLTCLCTIKHSVREIMHGCWTIQFPCLKFELFFFVTFCRTLKFIQYPPVVAIGSLPRIKQRSETWRILHVCPSAKTFIHRASEFFARCTLPTMMGEIKIVCCLFLWMLRLLLLILKVLLSCQNDVTMKKIVTKALAVTGYRYGRL
jgi:hypothetical protein